jgi:hypothetical protein
MILDFRFSIKRMFTPVGLGRSERVLTAWQGTQIWMNRYAA